MYIKQTAEIAPMDTPHGEIVRELMGAAAGGTQQHSLAHITLPAGTASLKHYHPSVEESYFVLAGRGCMMIGSNERGIQAGDAVAIPVNAVHQIINDTDEVLEFLAICAPPWTPDCSVFVE